MQFKDVLGRFATGVTVVTALEDGVPVGFTCQAFASLSLEPPLVVLAPAKTSTSWPHIVKAGTFCVNVLADTQARVSEAFAVPHADKFAGVAWRAGAAGTPVLEGVIAWIECALEMVHDAGDHELVVGRVLELGTGEGGPLLFYRRGYGSFAPTTGAARPSPGGGAPRNGR